MRDEIIEAFHMLGVPLDSDREALGHAYRRLARATHPDVSADPEAEQRFAALTDAYRLACQSPGQTPARTEESTPRVWDRPVRLGHTTQPARGIPFVVGPVRRLWTRNEHD